MTAKDLVKITIMTHPFWILYQERDDDEPVLWDGKDLGEEVTRRYRAGLKRAVGGGLVVLPHIASDPDILVNGIPEGRELEAYTKELFATQDLLWDPDYFCKDRRLEMFVRERRKRRELEVYTFGDETGACVGEHAVIVHKELKLTRPVIVQGQYSCPTVNNMDFPSSARELANDLRRVVEPEDYHRIALEWKTGEEKVLLSDVLGGE